VGLRAGIGQAIGKVQTRRVTPLAEAQESADGEGADHRGHRDFRYFRFPQKQLIADLREIRRNVEFGSEHHRGLEANAGGREAAVRQSEFAVKMLATRFCRQDSHDYRGVDENY